MMPGVMSCSQPWVSVCIIFFDNEDQALLLEKLRRYLYDSVCLFLVEKCLSAEVWDGISFEGPERGIPQGSPGLTGHGQLLPR